MKRKDKDINRERFQDSALLTEIGGNDGLKVPDGYFNDFATRMSALLPDRPELESPVPAAVPKTFWQSVRPYVYLAAMFMGIWCMLKMFTLMSGDNSDASRIDSNPVLAEAIGSESFVEDYIGNDISQWDVIDQMFEDGIEFSMFEEEVSEADILEAAQAMVSEEDSLPVELNLPHDQTTSQGE